VKDHYPPVSTLDGSWLVAPPEQPEYLPLDGVDLDGGGLGDRLAAAHVRNGLGDQVAIIHHEGGSLLTYGQLAAAGRRAAAAFASIGVGRGDRVALRGPNCPEMLVAAIGAWTLGAAVVPTPAQSRCAELRFFLTDTAPTVLLTSLRRGIIDEVALAVDGLDLTVVGFDGPPDAVTEHRWEELLDTAPDLPSNDDVDLRDQLALVWHTGGTTGRPKGCYHTQRRFLLAGYSIGRATGCTPGSVWAGAVPVGHALGFIYHTIYTLLHGATVVLIESFADPDAVLTAIATHRVEVFTAVAATWARMLESLAAGSAPEPVSLRRGYAMWQTSSSSTVTQGWRRHGIELLNNFGSTSFATWVLVADEESPPGALGKSAPGYTVLAIDPAQPGIVAVPPGAVGRMAVRGPTGLTYWRRPDMQATDVVDGWTLVDDLIRIDENGDVTYLGRTDFMISTAGNKVAPAEVEAVLAEHPAVQELAVVGLPDPLRQEIVAAFVMVAPEYEASAQLARELQDHVKARLAPYKYPRRIEFISELPRDHVGKVLPRALQQQYRADSETAATIAP
jgi:2-aminobenzoate-CoA ligase